MKAFVSIAIACILLATGSPFATAQNSTISQPPASTATVQIDPNIATKNDLRRTEGKITKALTQAQAESKAEADRAAQQLKDQQAATDKKIGDLAQQQAEAQRTAEQNAQAREKKLFGEIAAVAVFAIIILAIIVGRWREEKHTNELAEVAAPLVVAQTNEPAQVPTLSVSAKPDEVRAFAEANGLVGKTIPYVAKINVPDPQDHSKEIFTEIHGEVHDAGTDKEKYHFGRHYGVAKQRFDAAKRAHRDLQNIHVVQKTA